MPAAAVDGEDVVVERTITPEELTEYKTEGFLLLKGLVSPETAEALRAEVMGIMNQIGLGQTKLRQTHEYLAGSEIDHLANSPRLREIASTLMEGPSSLYLPFTAVKSGAVRAGETGGGEFHFHQDNQYTRFDGPGINLWFALSPMTEDNGCLRVVPRSHLEGTLPSFSPENDGHKAVTFAPEQFEAVRMEPGDCIAFSRLTVHGSGPNTTLEPRVAYAVQFSRDDINYSTDGGQTWVSVKEVPRFSVGPVESITIPKGKLDGH